MTWPRAQSSAAQGGVEAAGLTARRPAGNLNPMRRFIFAAGVSGLLSMPAGAQAVPGRDLLDFPIGTLADAPALSTHAAGGYWNPAAVGLGRGIRARGSVAALDASAEQAVSAQMLALSVAVPRDVTASLSVVRAGVADIRRTETDPQSVGSDVPYSTTVVSAGLARRAAAFLTGGLALRYRTGVSAGVREAVIGVDGGVVVDGLPFRDARLGVSTHLWRPGSRRDDRPLYAAAADLRALGTGPGRELRGGYGYASAGRDDGEHFLFGAGRGGRVEARAGVARITRYGQSQLRLRLGVGVHHARYVVGVARDESGAGLAPTYQFTLSTSIQ